jgi:hypothetical protein
LGALENIGASKSVVFLATSFSTTDGLKDILVLGNREGMHSFAVLLPHRKMFCFTSLRLPGTCVATRASVARAKELFSIASIVIDVLTQKEYAIASLTFWKSAGND